MNKLIFRVPSPISGNNMRITPKTREYINQIKAETNLPATQIVEACMKFAVENYEVEEI